DAQYRAAALSATRKLEAVLPEPLRAEVRYLQDNIRFVAQHEPSSEQAHQLAQIRRALIERKTIQFDYHARFGDEGRPLPQRTVNPFAIVNIDNVWYLVGYDHARRGIRHFRLERVSAVQVINKTFERPKQFQLQERGESGRNLRIRALFDAEVARWVREASNFYVTAMEDTREGLLVTLEVRQAQEVLPWLLSWGGHVRVVEPEAVKELVRGEAERIVEMYTA